MNPYRGPLRLPDWERRNRAGICTAGYQHRPREVDRRHSMNSGFTSSGRSAPGGGCPTQPALDAIRRGPNPVSRWVNICLCQRQPGIDCAKGLVRGVARHREMPKRDSSSPAQVGSSERHPRGETLRTHTYAPNGGVATLLVFEAGVSRRRQLADYVATAVAFIKAVWYKRLCVRPNPPREGVGLAS